MPVCTNIPMIYEPEKDATGNLAETEIKAAGDKYTEVAANLKFTCVKVKLNLIFDPKDAEVATNFGGKLFSINSISADKLSPFTHLYWGGKFETPTWPNNEDKEAYKDGIPSTLYEASERPNVYYTDWTDNKSLPATNNKDDIEELELRKMLQIMLRINGFSSRPIISQSDISHQNPTAVILPSMVM